MNPFKPGDRVALPYYGGRYAYGIVTIIRGDECKVMFDGDFDFNYDYYLAKDLKLESVVKRVLLKDQ